MSSLKRTSTTSSPKKTTIPRKAEEIEAREHLTEAYVALSHDRTTEYLITQHRSVVEDLRRDNAALREENAILK